MTLQLTFARVDEKLIDEYVALSCAEYTDRGVCKASHLRWKHLSNPAGPSFSYNLHDGHRLVGRLLYQKRNFHQNGSTLRGAYLVDLLIHPEYRGIRTFNTLLGKLRDVDGIDFIYFTPNATSIPLYRAVLGLRSAFDLATYAAPIRFGALLERRFKRRHRALDKAASVLWMSSVALGHRVIRQISEVSFSEEVPSADTYTALVSRALPQQSNRLLPDRTFAFHRWRFHHSPYHKYNVHYLYKRGHLAGYLATRTATYEGFRCLFLIDALVLPTLTAADHVECVLHCLRSAQRSSCDILLTIVNPVPGSARVSTRFPLVRVPEKMLPQQVPVFFVPLHAGVSEPAPGDMTLTLADMDVF